METLRELKRLTAVYALIEVITHGFLVREVNALPFFTQLHARLLDGKTIEETISQQLACSSGRGRKVQQQQQRLKARRKVKASEVGSSATKHPPSRGGDFGGRISNG
jgi:hypothetical protein